MTKLLRQGKNPISLKFVLSLSSLASATSTSGHVRFEEPSAIHIEIQADGTWTARAQLDAEFIYLNAPEGWFDESTQEELDALYWDHSVEGSHVREATLESLTDKVQFTVDGKPVESDLSIGIDPTFQYEASQGQSLWGFVEYSGKLPENSEVFELSAPAEFYPLTYQIESPNSSQTESDFFEINSERSPRPFSISKGSFSISDGLH